MMDAFDDYMLRMYPPPIDPDKERLRRDMNKARHAALDAGEPDPFVIYIKVP